MCFDQGRVEVVTQIEALAPKMLGLAPLKVYWLNFVPTLIDFDENFMA